MKILMCGNHPCNKGGMSTVIKQITGNNWKDKGIELRFIPSYYPGNVLIKILFFCTAFVKIVFTLITWKPDLVHTHMSSGASILRNRIICYSAHFWGMKTIVHIHGSQLQDYYLKLNYYGKRKVKKFFESVNLLIVLGEKWKQFILDISPESNVVVLNNSVEIPEQIRKKEKNIFCILYSGVLIDRKGVIYLLKAIKKMIENGENKISVKIAGSGEKLEELENYCKDNNIVEYVKFLGWVDAEKMNDLYRWADILVLPSFNEGLPMAILEAIANAVPVIATDVGSISEAIIDNYNGFLCKKGNVESLYEKMKTLYQSENMLHIFSNNSYELARNRFSLSAFYEKLERIYFGEMFIDSEKKD